MLQRGAIIRMNKKEFVKYTIDVWQPYYEDALTEQDAVDIANNMSDFMNLLIRWDNEAQEAKNNLAKLSAVDSKKERGNLNETELQN